MKFAADRLFADPKKAARKLIEIANATQSVQDGRIHIERSICYSCAPAAASTNTEPGLSEHIADGWLIRHESGFYVKFTQAGADLFA